MSHLEMRHFKINSFGEVMDMSDELAKAFPLPDQAKIGIYELLLNALEHGNLELGYERKTELLRLGKWEEEIQSRLLLPQYRERYVDIKLITNDNSCSLSIKDQGKGFRWKHYITSMASGIKPNGRGLLIAFNCNFDHIKFNDIGNEVTCVAKLVR